MLLFNCLYITVEQPNTEQVLTQDLGKAHNNLVNLVEPRLLQNCWCMMDGFEYLANTRYRTLLDGLIVYFICPVHNGYISSTTYTYIRTLRHTQISKHPHIHRHPYTDRHPHIDAYTDTHTYTVTTHAPTHT